MAPPMIVRDDLTWAGGCWVDKQEGIADILFDQADGSRLRVRLPMVELVRVYQSVGEFIDGYIQASQSSMQSGMASCSAITSKSVSA